jgi:signal transduction histidine kinase
MNIVLLCLLFPTISIFYFQKTSDFRDEQLQRSVSERTTVLREKAAQLARSLSSSGSQAISGYNFTFLNDLAKKAVANDPEFIGCQFVSNTSNGSVSAGTGFPGRELKAYTDLVTMSNTGKSRFPDEEKEDEQLEVVFANIEQLAETSDIRGLIAVAPVYVGGRLWGTVVASFSLELVDRDIKNITDEWDRQMRNYKVSFLTITLIFVIVGIVSVIILTRPLLRSIDSLRMGVETVSKGELEHKIFFRGLACEEFVTLSKSFNDMTDSLREAKKQLDDYSHSLEDQVDERTRELEEAQAELLVKAHEAGMAEMAVGVLHNIGNAITPVKVGTSTLIQHLRNSPLRTSLKDTMENMPEAIRSASGLPEKEKERIAAILELLPESIQEEYDQIIGKIEQISEKHRYIENVINLQMHYARLKGRAELVDVNRIVKDALKMLAEMIEKHGIEIVTSFQQVEMIRLEEGKMLQILVNLIKNGCEAMYGDDAAERKLFITTSQRDGEKPAVVLSVKDTGCGFTPEEKKNFFSFGYSTKERGTGFGLHSSANYLIANNGTIEARSDGPGRGAEFIITLPAIKITA